MWNENHPIVCFGWLAWFSCVDGFVYGNCFFFIRISLQLKCEAQHMDVHLELSVLLHSHSVASLDPLYFYYTRFKPFDQFHFRTIRNGTQSTIHSKSNVHTYVCMCRHCHLFDQPKIMAMRTLNNGWLNWFHELHRIKSIEMCLAIQRETMNETTEWMNEREKFCHRIAAGVRFWFNAVDLIRALLLCWQLFVIPPALRKTSKLCYCSHLKCTTSWREEINDNSISRSARFFSIWKFRFSLGVDVLIIMSDAICGSWVSDQNKNGMKINTIFGKQDRNNWNSIEICLSCSNICIYWATVPIEIVAFLYFPTLSFQSVGFDLFPLVVQFSFSCLPLTYKMRFSSSLYCAI